MANPNSPVRSSLPQNHAEEVRKEVTHFQLFSASPPIVTPSTKGQTEMVLEKKSQQILRQIQDDQGLCAVS